MVNHIRPGHFVRFVRWWNKRLLLFFFHMGQFKYFRLVSSVNKDLQPNWPTTCWSGKRAPNFVGKGSKSKSYGFWEGEIQHGGDQFQDGKTWCALRLMWTVVLTLRIIFGLPWTWKKLHLFCCIWMGHVMSCSKVYIIWYIFFPAIPPHVFVCSFDNG